MIEGFIKSVMKKMIINGRELHANLQKQVTFILVRVRLEDYITKDITHKLNYCML